ncbi:MAG: hypothetical protein H0U89_07800 [Acidimicrobiia bacterium]|nr:hypothetical protein [Acidimicrobiia bacterium]
MRSPEFDRALRQLAEGQHLVVSRGQALELGATGAMLARRVHAGEWRVVGRRCLVLSGAPETFELRCMVAVLDAGRGAAVSRLGAAALWGLPGFDEPGEVEVTRSRDKPHERSRTVVAHEPLLFPLAHRSRARGVPVTTVARTIFDLAGFLHPHRVERALDNALAHKRTNLGRCTRWARSS